MKSVNSDRVEVANKQGRYTQNYTHTQAREIHVHMHVRVCVRVTYKKKHLYATLNVKRSQVLSTCAGCALARLDAANSIWHLGRQKHNKYTTNRGAHTPTHTHWYTHTVRDTQRAQAENRL